MDRLSASGRERFLVELLTSVLDAYQRGEVVLARLVADVESAVDALLAVADRAWVEELRSLWWGLEIVYSVALDEGRATLTDDERSDIGDTISELRSLLARVPLVELRIRDRRADRPGLLVGLSALLVSIDPLRPGVLHGRWMLGRGCHGYGEDIVALERSAASDDVEVDGAEIFGLLIEDRQYLEHGRLSKLGPEPLELGVFDSGYLFLRAPRSLADAVAKEFVHTELIALAHAR